MTSVLDTFRLDPSTGILYPAARLSEKHRNFMLIVRARDEAGSGPHQDEATVVIDVLAVNKYKPKFIVPANANATISIPEVSASTKSPY